MPSVRLATTAHVAKRVVSRLATATPEQYSEGVTWYENARDYVTTLANYGGLTKTQVAGIIAALSPQTRWNLNLDGARRVVAAKRNRKRLPSGVTLYSTNARKAWRIAAGSDPMSILRGKKVVPFYRNLVGDESAVTVDTWVWKGAGLNGSLTDSKNRAIQTAYKVAAKRMGLSPAQAQAIDWIIVRGKSN